MIDFSSAKINDLIIHKVGNKFEGDILLSEQAIELNPDLLGLLSKYFLDSFKSSNELFEFYHRSDLNLNEVYSYSKGVLTEGQSFIDISKNIAKCLYDASKHPNILLGELYLVSFEDLIIDGEVVEGIGIFKSENKETFLKVYPGETGFGLEAEEGVNINKLDKGAIIFNTNQEDGYIVSIVDRTNKNQEAKYWKDDFLKVKPLEDEYYTTNQYLDMVKNFAIEGHPADDKSEKVDLLNRTVGYFKEKETFDEEEFQEIVLQAPETREAFDNYKSHYASTHEMDGFQDEFEISSPAVKQAKRGIRSVIKLDKNFHLYVHGKRDLIERGYDPDKGLNFYKVFFEHEA